MGKIKLNKKQKPIVANWCNSRKNARIERLIDRTCQYKDAIALLAALGKSTKQPHELNPIPHQTRTS